MEVEKSRVEGAKVSLAGNLWAEGGVMSRPEGLARAKARRQSWCERAKEREETGSESWDW